jgi:hypothetical protein
VETRGGKEISGKDQGMNAYQRVVFRHPIWVRAIFGGVLFGSLMGGLVFLATQSLPAALLIALASALLIGISGGLQTARLKREGVDSPRTASEAATAQGVMQGGDWTLSKAILGGIGVALVFGITVNLVTDDVGRAAAWGSAAE